METIYLVIGIRNSLVANGYDQILDCAYTKEEYAWKRIEKLYYRCLNMLANDTYYAIDQVVIYSNGLSIYYRSRLSARILVQKYEFEKMSVDKYYA